MIIYVNGRPAVLKTGTSFDYTAENRLFMGRDGYTLSIAFPLKGCQRNIDIFGHINRVDMDKKDLRFECSIVDGEVSLYGTLSVVKVSEVEIECQFAEGRCAQTVKDPFEEVSVVDLDLGAAPTSSYSDVTPPEAWRSIDDGAREVALPWINESSPTSPNNWVKFAAGAYTWDEENMMMSWQPYLIVIAKRICEAIGYDYDFAEWESSQMRHLIVCNVLPGAWEIKEYAKALPDWSVSEFFQKLELFMMCEFDFDHEGKSVKMRFSKNVLAEIAPVKIDDIVDSYSVDVAQADNVSCDYLAVKRLAYKSCSHSLWSYYSCDWYVQSCRTVKRYPTLEELIDKNKRRVTTSGGVTRIFWGEDGRGEIGATVNQLLYADDVDTYFVFRSIGTLKYVGLRVNYSQKYVLQPVNVFGSGSAEDESTDTEEIEFVPVCICDTYVDKNDDKGYMMFLNPSGYDGGGVSDNGRPGNGGLGDNSTETEAEPGDVVQPIPAAMIENGENEKTAAYYDEVYLAFWPGVLPDPGKMPYPVIDGLSMVSPEWTNLSRPGLSMRISGGNSILSELPQINPAQKFKFSWISTRIPNPRAIFNIRGKRYLCEKISATFTESGMSQLLKGEFYRIAD